MEVIAWSSKEGINGRCARECRRERGYHTGEVYGAKKECFSFYCSVVFSMGTAGFAAERMYNLRVAIVTNPPHPWHEAAHLW